MKKRDRKHIHSDPEGLFIPAGLLIGLGLGGFVGNWGAGILFGLGGGFLAMALIRLNKKK